MWQQLILVHVGPALTLNQVEFCRLQMIMGLGLHYELINISWNTCLGVNDITADYELQQLYFYESQ